MTDPATRATLATLAHAAAERAVHALARAEDLHRAAAQVLRALHTDHDSSVAALERARRTHAFAVPSACARSARAVEHAGEIVRALEVEINRARAAVETCATEVAMRRQELAQHLARRQVLQRPELLPAPDDD